MKQFWLQAQAPNGNWADQLGADNKQSCIDHGTFLASESEGQTKVRVVERVDTVIWEGQ